MVRNGWKGEDVALGWKGEDVAEGLEEGREEGGDEEEGKAEGLGKKSLSGLFNLETHLERDSPKDPLDTSTYSLKKSMSGLFNLERGPTLAAPQ